MTWMLLRCGWGNSAAIFALALLPVVVAAGLALDQLRAGEEKARVVIAEHADAADPSSIAPAPIAD